MPFDLFAKESPASTHKAHTFGTHRVASPEETLQRVSPFLPIMGITRIANVTGLDRIGIPVVMVTRPNARSIAVSQGKGATLTAAKVSGVMESIESYHAERVTLPVKFASYEEMRWTHRLVDIGRLPRLAGSTYDPFSPMLWIEGVDLFSGTAKWVPFETVHLNFTVPMPPGSGAFIASSNGLASGNSELEAAVHAITELIERDAATLWHLGGTARQERTRLDLATINDPLCRSLIDRFHAAQVAIAAWDITSDVGVPAFLVRAVGADENERRSVRPATGMGCHSAREIALARALTEVAQSRLTFISGARDDMPRAQYQKHLDADGMATWSDRILRGDGRLDFNHSPTAVNATLDSDLSHLLGQLKAVGVDEAVAVSLTKPEFGIPVVRVVIPGLESIDDQADYLYGSRAERLLENRSC